MLSVLAQKMLVMQFAREGLGIGTPLGLMAISPSPREMPLALPNV
jgi:hypothetical protein